MKLLRPPTLRGHWPVHGFLFDLDTIGESQARERIFALWRPGAKVLRHERRLVLLLPQSEWRSVATAPGYPLLKLDERLATAPFAAEQIRALDAPRDSLLFLRSGKIQTLHLRDAQTEDVSSWIEFGTLALMPLESIGADPPPPPPPAIAEPREVREILGDEALRPSSKLISFMAALKARNEARKAAATGKPGSMPGRFSLAAPLAIGAGALSGLFRMLSRIGAGRGASGNASGSGGGRAPALSRPSKPPSEFFQNISIRLAAIAHRLVFRHVFGPKQAAYLNQLMKLFEQGNMSEALRRAIPLGGEGEALRFSWLASFFGAFGRGDLTINPQGTRNSVFTFLSFGELDVYSMLQKMYRKAYEDLDKQGKVKEAAFVLAELLNDPAAAVKYLESHGELRLAAELAEGRKLPPAVIVRQWFLAKETVRALDWAKRTNSFSEAVHLLEDSNKKEEAIALRIAWGAIMAAAGNHAAAVDAVWPVEAAREAAETWIDEAIRGGGVPAVRMMVRKISLRYESLNELLPHFKAILDSTDRLSAPLRLAFSTAMIGDKKNFAIRSIARYAARAILRDLVAGTGAWREEDLNRMLYTAQNPELTGDIPKTKYPKPERNADALRTRAEPLVMRFDDAGTTPVYDCIAVGRGRFLLALGEAGIALVNGEGKTIATWRAPAHSFAISDSRNRFIAIAKAGKFVHLSRLNLDSRRCDFWAETQIDLWSRTFDGVTWLVGQRIEGAPSSSRVMKIDFLADGFQTLWEHASGGYLLAINRENTEPSNDCVSLHYDFIPDEPAPIIRRIHRAEEAPREVRLRWQNEEIIRSRIFFNWRAYAVNSALAAMLAPLAWKVTDLAVEFFQSDGYALPFTRTVPLFPTGQLSIDLTQKWFIMRIATGSPDPSVHVLLYEVAPKFDNQCRAELILCGAKEASIDCHGEFLTIADNTGRILQIDLADGALLTSLRI